MLPGNASTPIVNGAAGLIVIALVIGTAIEFNILQRDVQRWVGSLV
jgi:hypothetical protein